MPVDIPLDAPENALKLQEFPPAPMRPHPPISIFILIFIPIVIFISNLISPLPASAQSPETLQTILDRGHVRQWLIAGPFMPDVEGGILAAVSESRPRLGEHDFLTPIGGIRRARPQDRLAVTGDDGSTVTWQLVNRTASTLDLAPLLENRSEGVVFAAFYAVADRPQTVLMEIESTLGARVAHNGNIVHDIASIPPADLDTQWLVLQMRAGANVVILELPAALLDEIAVAANADSTTLAEAVRRSRPMLTGTSGAELGVRLHPVEQAGTLYAIPELLPTGAYTGSVTEPRKEVALRVYNADSRSSRSVTATVTRLRGNVALRRSLSAVPPRKVGSLLFEVPLGGAAPGTLESVAVHVVHGASAIQFRTALLVEPPPTAGTVAYVLRPAARTAADYLPSYRANALLSSSADEFGFNLGPGYLWRAGWARFPEVRDVISRAVPAGQVAADTAFAVPDPRLTDTTVFVRSIQLGRAMAESFLADWEPAYIAWDQPALPWRFADTFAATGGEGLVDNLAYPGREPLGILAGPGGESIAVRHKRNAVNPDSKPHLRDTARLQRTETAETGIRTDIMIGEYEGLPDPFWADDSISLQRSVPSVQVTGAGARLFVEAMPLAEAEGFLPQVSENPARLSLRPGELVAQPAIKAAHARTVMRLEQAETLATLAGIAGAAFPDAAIDAAWREVLWASESDRLGYAADFDTFAATLSAYRRAAQSQQEVRNAALDALALNADTYTGAPTRVEGIEALVVFNTASFPRSDVVRADIELDQAAGFRLIDAAGREVSYVADEVVIRNQRIARIRFSFVADHVPAFGHTTYYIAPESRPIVWGDAEGFTIENDWYELTVNPKLGGAVSSLKWKETGREFAGPGLNDIVARTESAINNQSGREIWSDGGVARASAVEAQVRKRIGPAAQRLEITVPFGGGEVVRTLTLYEGIDRVFGALHMRDVRRDIGLAGIEFPAPQPNPQAIVGDGLGMRTARVGAADAPYQTRGADHAGRAWEPASGWFYLGPGDAVRGEQDTGYPLRPVRIVLGDDAFADAAESLVRAFLSRGIPADLFDVRPRDRGAYTDAEPWQSIEHAGQMGEVLWVVLGDPQAAALGLPEANPGAVRFFAQGAGNLNGPVLALYGGDADTVDAAAADVSNRLERYGFLALEPDAIADAVELPNAGLAVFTEGSALVTFDRNAATWFVSHAGDPEGAHAAGWARDTRSVDVDYVIAPITGDWRSHRVAKSANAFANPLVAYRTTLHLGNEPSEHSYLAVSGEGVIAAGLRPTTMKAAAASLGETHPRDGVVLNVLETYGRAQEALIRSGGLGFDAGLLNGAGTIARRLRIERGEFEVDLGPNEFVLAGFRPAILKTIPSVDEHTPAASRLQWARPWEHAQPVLPKDGLPVTLEFREPAPTEKSSVILVIANNRSDAPVSGSVRIEASEGWAVGTPEIEYDLEPRQWREEILLLLRGHRQDSGYLVASTAQGDTEIVDVWPRTVQYTVEAERRADEVQVKIVNTCPVPLVGSVALICEPGDWPELGRGPGVSPREYTLRVNPYETRRMLFTLPDAEWNGPLAAQVALNGETRYVKVESP